jgi:DNA polymerase III gamma/tau subunit
VKHLGEIAAKEKVQIDDAALYAIARGAEGGMRDAESTLDQLISFCGNKIQESDVLSMFGLAARAQLLSLATYILEGNASDALREVNVVAFGRLVREAGQPNDEQEDAGKQSHRHRADHHIVRAGLHYACAPSS